MIVELPYLILICNNFFGDYFSTTNQIKQKLPLQIYKCFDGHKINDYPINLGNKLLLTMDFCLHKKQNNSSINVTQQIMFTLEILIKCVSKNVFLYFLIIRMSISLFFKNRPIAIFVLLQISLYIIKNYNEFKKGIFYCWSLNIVCITSWGQQKKF